MDDALAVLRLFIIIIIWYNKHIFLSVYLFACLLEININLSANIFSDEF